jgi:hypothetical protein
MTESPKEQGLWLTTSDVSKKIEAHGVQNTVVIPRDIVLSSDTHKPTSIVASASRFDIATPTKLVISDDANVELMESVMKRLNLAQCLMCEQIMEKLRRNIQLCQRCVGNEPKDEHGKAQADEGRDGGVGVQLGEYRQSPLR